MGSIKLPHASGNSMSIAAPATNPSGDLTLTLPPTIGTNGQYIKVDGSGNLSFGTITAGVVRTTANSAYSGSSGSIAFTGLDADATHHRLLLWEVSSANNEDMRWQAGTDSAYLTSGYKTSCGYLAGGSSTTVDGDTGFIRTDGMTTGTSNKFIDIDFYRCGTTHQWIVRGWGLESSNNFYFWITSNFTLSAALTKINSYVNSGNLDSGTIYLESFK